MKAEHIFKVPLAAALLLSAIIYQPSTVFAQGSLTPPGAPAPTMKTLDQIEARTPISSAPFTINSPGSYYLTKNLNVTNGDAITISANKVTLDLNGFTISSTTPGSAGTGILLTSGGRFDITIFNGHILSGVGQSQGVYSGNGFHNGISGVGQVGLNVRVANISVSGCLNAGIYIGSADAEVVESCTVLTVGGVGIKASSVSRCAVRDCGGTGIWTATASDCNVSCLGTDPGISATTVVNCSSFSDGGQGILAKSVSNCSGYSTSSQGIGAETASNCFGESTSNRGISANVVTSCSGRSDGLSYGIFATSIANTCYGYSTSGTGLYAFIAIGCTGTSVSYTYHYNMPP